MSAPAPVVLLMGPTAAGKTELAVALAERFPVSIVSVDSAMVYRGLDIGTGKPDAATLARAPHRLIDIRDPHQAYSAAEFRADALACIADIHRAGRVPLLVGGTGLYFRALRHGLSPLPPADPRLRLRLLEQAARDGWPALHARLRARDPLAARRIRASDPQRIQRALEVIELTGRPLSELQRHGRSEPCPHPVLALSLEPGSRDWLHERIERRLRAMLRAGLVAEVEALRRRGALAPELPASRAVGYRQVLEHLHGATDHETMVARALAATRQLARRQLTWLRGEQVHRRIEADAPRPAARLADALGGLLGR